MNRETDRLAAFEAMLAAACAEYEQTEAALRPLVAAGRERSATCRQLLARKLQLAQLLGAYRAYGLLEGGKPGEEEAPCLPV
ncbi:MAG: hypothetical protein ACI4PG_02300 [Candidatus Ventricola sp.]